ncbi:MAG TPA: DegV family protein [Firmicutes bacterium]|jgi:DegV family protein with EDD domain|nr:DegV family protein [Bacillota bacterium]
METVHLVTDSTCYLAPTIIDEYEIKIVPLRVNWGEESLREGIDIGGPEFFKRLRQSKEVPTTSQPPAGEFASCYRELGELGGSIISIHISGDLSGAVTAAEAAHRMLPELDIHIIDSRITCLGLGFMVWEAARMRAAGSTAEEIVARTKELVANMTAYFMVDDLNYLHRGGRIGAAQATLGSLLQVKPILTMKEAHGVINVQEKVRTQKKALARLVELTAADCAGAKKVSATVLHADNLSTAKKLEASLQAALPQAEIVLSEFGAVIGTHVGPGAVGIIFYTV